MGKKEKRNIQKHIPIYRTKEERQNEARQIIDTLCDLQLFHNRYDSVKDLFKQIHTYVNEGVRQEINIPFPSINRRIRGVLATNVRESVWVKLETEKF